MVMQSTEQTSQQAVWQALLALRPARSGLDAATSATDRRLPWEISA